MTTDPLEHLSLLAVIIRTTFSAPVHTRSPRTCLVADRRRTHIIFYPPAPPASHTVSNRLHDMVDLPIPFFFSRTSYAQRAKETQFTACKTLRGRTWTEANKHEYFIHEASQSGARTTVRGRALQKSQGHLQTWTSSTIKEEEHNVVEVQNKRGQRAG